MQNTYKGFTAARVTRFMVADEIVPATYWIVIGDFQLRVTAHRDIEMANNARGSSLVLDTPEKRVVLRWSGKPRSVVSATRKP